MRKIHFLTIWALILLPICVCATTVEVPVPELQGQYLVEDTYFRTAEFYLPQLPAVVHGFSIRLSGTTTIRTFSCDYPTPILEPVKFVAEMPEIDGSGQWCAYWTTSNESGEFSVTFSFADCSEGASWDFLADGVGSIILWGYGWPIIDGCLPITIGSEAFVNEAVLIIDAEFPIPVEPTTWGQIKALYDLK